MRVVSSLMTIFATFLCGEPLYNPQPYIPSECYIKTYDENGKTDNSCYHCHINSHEPNYANDGFLQLAYSFNDEAKTNRWTNLFEDKTEDISKISDDEILKYVKEDNYQKSLYDCDFNFDKDGFDRREDGSYTLWRAFSYTPLFSFYPINGAFDDVMIRLPKYFAQNEDKKFDIDIYKQNLEILSKLIEQKEKVESFVGVSKDYQKQGLINFSKGLFPIGTEFLHSVRYLDVFEGKIVMASRLKELRYAKKIAFYNYGEIKSIFEKEAKEKYDFPDRNAQYIGDENSGINNGQGWIYQGYIEDKDGNLRLQNYEETLFCMGCHSKLGATKDGIFSFHRKTSWQHMSIAHTIKQEMFPTIPKALLMNKAYKAIVEKQSFIKGRDATALPATNYFRQIPKDISTKLKEIR